MALPAGLTPVAAPDALPQGLTPVTPSLPHGLTPVAPPSGGGEHGRLTYQQLKDLWVKSGGDPQHSDIMAHVFMAESGDGKTFADPNANADHHTSYQENGKTYYPEGLGQVSTIHGQKNMLDPEANMKYSVGLFKSQGFGPWEASRHAGAGGGWGQYLNAHTHPDQPFQKLPSGGFAQVIGAHYQSAGIVPSTDEMRGTWLGDLADRMEGLAKGLSTTKPTQAQSLRAVHMGSGFESTKASPVRLSKTLQHVGELADVPTLDLGNALMRSANGDKTALATYWKGLQMPEGYDVNKSIFDPFETVTDINKQASVLGQHFGPNSAEDIGYWAQQPGVKALLPRAEASDPFGAAVLLAAGMHADLARLKPSHPYLTGAETTGMELVNPSYIAAGEVGGLTSRLMTGGLKAARAGAYGAATQRLANLAAEAGPIGNRFTRMGDAFGQSGETWHANLATSLHNAPYESQARFTSSDTFGGLTQEDQVNVVHLIQAKTVDPMGMPIQRDPKLVKIGQKVVGGKSLDDRAQTVRDLITSRDDEIRAIDPVAANTLIEDYFSQQRAWIGNQAKPTDPQYPQGVPSVSGGSSGPQGAPIPKGRVYDSLQQGLNQGAQIDPNWMPSGTAAQHDATLNRYVVTMRYIKALEQMHANGVAGSFDIPYEMVGSQGGIMQFGTGAKGLKRATEFATQAGAQRAELEGINRGWDPKKVTDMKGHYKDVVMDEMRKRFREKFPQHDFDAADSLGLEALKGKAVRNAAVDATIDAHPILSQLQKGGFDKYGVHTRPEEPQGTKGRLLDNINSIVRQGILSNVWYHGTFNLAPLALNEGVSPALIARALAIDPKGEFIPRAWIEHSRKYMANAPQFGTSLSMDPMLRAKVLTVPYKGLSGPERAMKALTQASKWNQDVTFGYFEDRLAAVLMHHYETKGKMSPEAAARRVRQVFGDYQNVTPFERAAQVRNWHYFYTWMRSQLRYWGGQAVTHPQSIMAPIEGVSTANQMQGDQGNVPGGALSLRSVLNAIHYGWGTDAHGNPRYVSIPTPQFRYGSEVMRTVASAASGDPTESTEVGLHLATSSMPPLAGIAARVATTAISAPGRPEPWNDLLWDKNAPSAGAMWMQMGSQVANEYMPSVLRGPAEAIAQKDPTQALGMLGPSVYSSPNQSRQGKAAYGMSIQLRSVVKSAEAAGDKSVATQVYDLMQRVDDGDPLAVIEARTKLKALRAELGIPTARRFGPRF